MRHIHYYYLAFMCIIMGTAASTIYGADEYNAELPTMATMHESALPPAAQEGSVYAQPIDESSPTFMLQEEVTQTEAPIYKPQEEEEAVYNYNQESEEQPLSEEE